MATRQYTWNTITELEAITGMVNGESVIVKDIDRGGTFVFDNTRTTENDGGIVFDGWVRQFDGYPNLVWFDTFSSAIASSKVIYVPKGTHVISATLSITTDITLIGEGKESVIHYTSATATYGISVSNTSLFEMKSIFLQADNIAEQGGVYISNCTEVEISDCYFDGFGDIVTRTGAQSPIFTDTVERARFTGNTFLSDSMNASGADINCSYRTSNVIVTDNYSESACDSFFYCGALGTDLQKNKHTISNNIIKRSRFCRSALLLGYDSSKVTATVTGNIIEGFAWNGIYLSNSNTTDGEDTGTVTIVGNIVRYCGGEDVALSAGIYLTGGSGVIASDNILENIGYDLSDIGGTYEVYGIFSERAARFARITNNIIKNVYGRGIYIVNSGTVPGIMDDILISGNSVSSCTLTGIRIANLQSGTHLGTSTIVSNNQIKATVSTCFEIIIANGALSVGNLDIHHNKFEGDGTENLVRTNTLTEDKVMNIRDNTFMSGATGINLELSANNKIIGTQSSFDRNTFTDCTTAMNLSQTTDKSRFFNGIKCIGTTPSPYGTRMYQLIDSDGDVVKFYADSTPTDASGWTTGDTVVYNDPATAGAIGSRYNGSTWVDYGTA